MCNPFAISNRFYFTGFRSSAGMLLIANQYAQFLIDFRYFERAQKKIKHCDVFMLTSAKEQMQKFANDQKIQRMFVETDSMTLANANLYASYLPEVELSFDPALNRYIKKMRSIKSIDEIENIRKAQKIADDTFPIL